MLRSGFPLAFTALLCAGMATAQTVDEAALQVKLMAINTRFMTAWQRHDAAALSTLMAPEFVYLGPQGVTSRDVVLNVLSSHLGSYQFGVPKMLREGPDGATVIYTIDQDLTCFGHPQPADVLNSDTFVLRDGRWMLLLTTSTTLAAHP